MDKISRDQTIMKAEALYERARKLKENLKKLNQTPEDIDRRPDRVEICNLDAKEGEISFGRLNLKKDETTHIEEATMFADQKGGASYSLKEYVDGIGSLEEVECRESNGEGISAIKKMSRRTGCDPSISYMEGTELDGSALANNENKFLWEFSEGHIPLYGSDGIKWERDASKEKTDADGRKYTSTYTQSNRLKNLNSRVVKEDYIGIMEEKGWKSHGVAGSPYSYTLLFTKGDKEECRISYTRSIDGDTGGESHPDGAKIRIWYDKYK